MAGFQFRLESVLKVRESRRDLCRQVLGQVLHEQQKLENQKKRIEAERQSQLDELKSIAQEGQFDVDAMSNRRYYAGQLSSQILEIEHQKAFVSQQIKLCRQALTKADQEVKVIEKLKEKQLSEYTTAQLKKETQELEEVWMSTHARRFKG